MKGTDSISTTKNLHRVGKADRLLRNRSSPPTIAELFKQVQDKFNIELPFIDLFKWGTNEDDINKIETAIDAGPTTVEGVTCEQYAFRQEGVDWQVWIQLGDYPLPRRLVITTLTDEARPQHSITLAWNLAPSFNDAAFVFDPPPDAKRVLFEGQTADRPGKGNKVTAMKQSTQIFFALFSIAILVSGMTLFAQRGGRSGGGGAAAGGGTRSSARTSVNSTPTGAPTRAPIAPPMPTRVPIATPTLTRTSIATPTSTRTSIATPT